MTARPAPSSPAPSTLAPSSLASDPADLDPEDAFGHSVLPDATRDAVWADGDEDDVDV
ncbi:hypothetical protein ACIPEQ_14135 [Curtobacterium sp. NPDC087080]|uniref:hypothetical protein n=1 Tax=Curtobacterium sp. NPDC087080 TaxID=3363965 RepID=UPI00380876CD